jgi:flavin reductase (DIM6/NTAB) family NADH-FMN oxidoreductase RutF
MRARAERLAKDSGHMSIAMRCRKLVQQIIFGDTLLPQEFFLGLADPQTEIAVWLHGMGTPIDVTRRHSMACAAPFTVCIAFDQGGAPSEKDSQNLSLKFCERGGRERVLGQISLKLSARISTAGMQLFLFEAQSSTNYCLPIARLWAHYLLQAQKHGQKADTSGMKMSFLERRAAMVMFIRPHPVSLVSLTDNLAGNIFPMNIMGDLGSGYCAFALKDSRRAAHLVERVRRIAVSTLPLPKASLAYQLAVNHTKESIAWDQLPFATRLSAMFNIPVPVFAQRVREMEIEDVRPIGSHTFFVAKVISDENASTEPGLSVIHGFYQAWRLKGRSAELATSLAQDAFHKKGF